jgi:hypothetical protein
MFKTGEICLSLCCDILIIPTLRSYFLFFSEIGNELKDQDQS